MRKHVSLLIAILVLSSHAAVAHADPVLWRWFLSGYANSQVTSTGGDIGVNALANNGHDALDQMIVESRGVYFGTYHSSATDGWTGVPGFYSSDLAAPMPLTPGLSRTWTVYLWADPVLSGNTSIIGLRWSYIAWTGPDWFTPPAEFLFALTLRSKPVGITGDPAVGTVWDLSAQRTGGVHVPIFRTANGLEGYVFDFTATVIPEPSSLLALAAGIGGIGLGFVRRRR